MKITPIDARGKAAKFIQLGDAVMAEAQTKTRATSIVLTNSVDPQLQHLAIGKLLRMCKASAVAVPASRGITAEVRRDRDRGHA